ncbi:MAG TPA: pyridoxal-5'-phosphate-dependent protein subunit beta [Clostridiales bacterium UBA8153]|nr:pyridoxal-5'-phosphate-dependent protein subunit beta [Clostridiales bacterium UBA8153]
MAGYFGPSYEEMLYPERVEPDLLARARQAAGVDELDPVNLFNITWKDPEGRVRATVLPPALTGVEANIIVLLGAGFPSGSHKVGPAYTTLMEGWLDGTIIPGRHTILGPSTGNFGIGVAYVCRLLGYRAIIIMPDGMSRERYQRIRAYGGELELTPGTESDVILTLERTQQLAKDPHNRTLAQFELFPNYRFHRYVTGRSAIEAAKGWGNGAIAGFAAAPGSAGTLAAGDEIKATFPGAKVAALEPYECPTLATGGRGHHRIEGIGDKMCTLIHNVLNTDFVILIHDDHAVKGLKVLRDGGGVLADWGVGEAEAAALRDSFGVSGVCNILGAIKLAKQLGLGPGENVVTVATDGFDRYPSVMEDLERRSPEITPSVLEGWARDVFRHAVPDHVYDCRGREAKARLFAQKEKDWLPFGYAREDLGAMQHPAFWEREYARVGEYDAKLLAKRRA